MTRPPYLSSSTVLRRGEAARIYKEGCGQEKIEDGERYRCVSHRSATGAAHVWGILPVLLLLLLGLALGLPDTGACPCCGRTVGVHGNGCIRPHRVDGQQCPGTGERPTGVRG